MILAVVGIKKDLNSSSEKETKEFSDISSEEEAKEFSEIIKCPFKLISTKDKDNIKNLFEYLIFEIYAPFYLKNNYLISNTSNLKIYSFKNEIIKKDVAFTPIFNEMVDLIHFIISTNTSLIFEGFPGQGKQKAINYICDLLGYEVENIIITTNFTVKDLEKKTVVKSNNGNVELVEIETKLNEKLNPKSKSTNLLSTKKKRRRKKKIIKSLNKKILFVFHNIEKSESDVLSKISEIFNKKSNSDDYAFIGIINIQESLIERDSYYNNYFCNSIYYIVNYTNSVSLSYLNQIIPYELNIDKNLFLKYYRNNENYNENIYSLSDISKFKKIKEVSKFKDSFIEEIIFKNKSLFYINEKKQDKSPNNKFKLDFYFNNNTKKLEMKVDDNEISFTPNKIFEDFEKEKNTLSYEQIKCLIFLGLSVKSELSCIIEGSTGIGKSHLIKLLAKILGKKLHIFELNKDNQISLLTKCCTFKKYNKEELRNMNEMLGISGCDEIEHLEKKILEMKDDKKKMKQLADLRKKYSFISRFNYEKSDFLQAVENGEWILLDGIENAPSIIVEKLTLLCGEERELNLYENDSTSIIKAAPGFHLFITYNSQRSTKTLSKTLVDKCLIYNLKSFMENEENISQIIFGYLVNNKFISKQEILLSISSKYSNIQNIIKEKLKNTISNNISERTIINFCKNLKSYDENSIDNDKIKNLCSNFKNNFLYFYYPSLEKREQEEFGKIINENIEICGKKFQPLANSFEIECSKKKLLYLLGDIIENKNDKFNFSKFLNECLQVPFKYLKDLIIHTKKLLHKFEKLNNFNGIIWPLNIFIYYFKSINLNNKNLNGTEQNLKNKNLNETEIGKIYDSPIIRNLLLFSKLNDNNLFSWDYIELLDGKKIKIFDCILEMYKNLSVSSLKDFLKEINENINYIFEIIELFPYSKFINTKFSLLNNIMRKIFKSSAENKINFIINLNNQEY